jgi:hypothetical protein
VPSHADEFFNNSVDIDEMVGVVFRTAGKTKGAFCKIEKKLTANA